VVDEDVFGLEVAVDDVKSVKILEREDHLRRVERRVRLAIYTASSTNVIQLYATG